MVKMINILLTSAGRRVPLINAFKKALDCSKEVTGKVICVDMDPLSSGLYVGDGYHLVPGADNPRYVPALLEICLKEKITLLIPTTDEELLVLSKEREHFLSWGVRIIVSSHETVGICNDKLETYNFLSKHNISVPRSYHPEDLPPEKDLIFPLFIKPRTGKGSVQCFRINDFPELQHHLKVIPQPIIQHFIAGKEFTVDVMCDLSGRVIIAVPRERIATSGGVSQKGRTEKNPCLEELSATISKKLNIIGPANIQFIVSNTGPRCIEINPRFSGGIPLTLAAGANFPRMLLDMAAGKKVEQTMGQFKEDLYMLRYDESIFLEEGTHGYVPYDPL